MDAGSVGRRARPGLPGLLAPRRLAHAHESDAKPGARVTNAARPVRRLTPHHQVRRPLVALGADAPSPDALSVGRKALSLWWLSRQGVPVPPAVAIPADIAARLLHGDSALREMLRAALERWVDPDASYAVRSSADVEDGEEHSFAGQFTTLLDVPPDDLLTAITDVADPRSERLSAYLKHTGATDVPHIGVIVQRMVPARAAGVAFSRNPLTGLGETVIEAVPGPGHVLVDEGVTPDRWVRRWGEFTTAPDHPRVGEHVIRQVADAVARLAEAMGRPLDRRVGVRWRATLVAPGPPHDGPREPAALLQPHRPRGPARHHQAPRLVGERAHRQRRLDRPAGGDGRAPGDRTRGPGALLRRTCLFRHDHARRHLRGPGHAARLPGAAAGAAQGAGGAELQARPRVRATPAADAGRRSRRTAAWPLGPPGGPRAAGGVRGGGRPAAGWPHRRRAPRARRDTGSHHSPRRLRQHRRAPADAPLQQGS